LIWGLLVWLNIEAVNRILTPPGDIDADLMLITSIIGFLCNITNFVALNCACGHTELEDEEDDNNDKSSFHQSDFWTIDNKTHIRQQIKKP
jgi:Co/Zn/Cd efflux system component